MKQYFNGTAVKFLACLCLFVSFFGCLSCHAKSGGRAENAPAADEKGEAVQEKMSSITELFVSLNIPVPNFTGESLARFEAELADILAADSAGLLILADKSHFLSAAYEPDDLVTLKTNAAYTVSKNGMQLRSPAEQALSRMGSAAKKDGVTLVASSAYRSYKYQETVYGRIVRELGQEAADRESARPGTSQHQLGTVVDFGSITDEFAETKAGRWLAQNAASFGFSLSFPDGYENVTGYRWESWHYRYVGENAARFQQNWFGGIQQYMLEFLHAWKNRA